MRRTTECRSRPRRRGGAPAARRGRAATEGGGVRQPRATGCGNRGRRRAATEGGGARQQAGAAGLVGRPESFDREPSLRRRTGRRVDRGCVDAAERRIVGLRSCAGCWVPAGRRSVAISGLPVRTSPACEREHMRRGTRVCGWHGRAGRSCVRAGRACVRAGRACVRVARACVRVARACACCPVARACGWPGRARARSRGPKARRDRRLPRRTARARV